ncbi:programmed cell death protein 2 [Phycomyces blakesleeanus]|uniref:Programmed cell death protein 2 C-terminal domain-containing protein n=2 Tax=Phycomyces blakesleeanus TaxID=4837 RepID=A0A167PZI4_PHYB8|nr:hypothetical protein PHYBLDRAFT_62423 [Phycomyces blakesleeanus NRRL 1555(-)]OAD78818.1 hypothetical protein PHYBLDRAFT_62423 [Phycomyces blakesleeanus NRRL 1555(-)]|eukprot:XP_018296858.1 hypothetical protein PHYBLDRAFT_62423 [Phycomyces blakesleeanus NRRL 1555(-)]
MKHHSTSAKPVETSTGSKKTKKTKPAQGTKVIAPKKAVPVLIGKPDGPVQPDEDVDAYSTKIGGLPVWLNPDQPPSVKACTCQVCGSFMYLIFQGYVPLPDSPYHRVIYVWACNKRECMRKDGSFSVIRSHLVDPGYLKTLRQKEAKKKAEEEAKAKAKANQKQPFGVPAGFQLGDLWGASSSFSTSNANANSNLSQPTAGFGQSANKTPMFGALPAVSKPTETLAEKLSKMSIQPKPPVKAAEPKKLDEITNPVDVSVLPHFPGHYLYIADENTESYETLGLDMSRYQQYIDMEAEILAMNDEDSNAAAEEGGTWAGETYEKQALPRGVDKEFKKFTERVACEANQCVRYDWQGTPLFYSKLQPAQQQMASRPCGLCGAPRIFECQLMPTILSLLPTTEYAERDQVPDPTAKKVDRWSIGMEFGTLLVYVCSKDCHPTDVEQPCHIPEVAIVQYETD